jgi:hypothetical protein
VVPGNGRPPHPPVRPSSGIVQKAFRAVPLSDPSRLTESRKFAQLGPTPRASVSPRICHRVIAVSTGNTFNMKRRGALESVEHKGNSGYHPVLRSDTVQCVQVALRNGDVVCAL